MSKTIEDAIWYLMGSNLDDLPEVIGLDPKMTVEDLQEALELLRIKRTCTCGYGGYHEPENERCAANS